MPRLTQTFVKNTLPPLDGKDLFLWDEAVKGFGVRVYASGAKTFVFRYRGMGAKQRFLKLGKVGEPYTVEEARDKSREALRDIMEGRDPQEEKTQAREALTIEEVANLYITEGPKWRPKKRERSWVIERGLVKWHIIPLIGKMIADQFTNGDAVDFQKAVTDGKSARIVKTSLRGVAKVSGGAGAATKAMICLQTIFQWAIQAKKVKIDNPCIGIQRAAPNKIERILQNNERLRLLSTMEELEQTHQLNRPWGDIIRLLFVTGARSDEIVSLQWDEIDFSEAIITLKAHRHKTGTKKGQKTIMLPSIALEILNNIPKTSQYVFPSRKTNQSEATKDSPVKGLGKAWDKIRCKADLKDLRIHDLRHAFASFAVKNGGSLFLVGKAIGHSSQHMTEHYTHIENNPIHELVERTAKGLLEK